MQSSSEQPLVGEERYVTTRITAAKETSSSAVRFKNVPLTTESKISLRSRSCSPAITFTDFCHNQFTN